MSVAHIAGRRRRVLSRFSAACTLLVAACTSVPAPPASDSARVQGELAQVVAMARALAADSMRGRGPWTAENEQAARFLAASLERLGARPLLGTSVLVPFTTPDRPEQVVYNVAGVLPARDGRTSGTLVGLTAHFDHLGVGRPDSTGDTIYNGFLDAALPVAMVVELAARYARSPGDRPLAVLLFNLEEQGLLGAQALARRPDAQELARRLTLLIGVDAGSPAGEAVEWQLMGAEPSHPGARLADSLARTRGWTTTATRARPISDVYVFAQRGVPILFPIPGATWKGYTRAEREAAMREFDHYHAPADEWNPAFPLEGTRTYLGWLWEIVAGSTGAPARHDR